MVKKGSRETIENIDLHGKFCLAKNSLEIQRAPAGKVAELQSVFL